MRCCIALMFSMMVCITGYGYGRSQMEFGFLVKRSLKMLPPEVKIAGKDKGTLETEYFKPKEYQSRDLPRLLDGLGKQIRRDLNQAHLLVASQSSQVQRLQERMDQLEKEMLPMRSLSSTANDSSQEFLASFGPFLLIFLVLLIAVQCFLLIFRNICGSRQSQKYPETNDHHTSKL